MDDIAKPATPAVPPNSSDDKPFEGIFNSLINIIYLSTITHTNRNGRTLIPWNYTLLYQKEYL